MTSARSDEPVWALEVPSQHVESAELVRRHLVVLRGGVLFLSSRDGAALVQWLDDGVPVARILAALEIAAERRRQRGERAPLQLTHASRHLGRAAARARSEAASHAPAAPAPALAHDGDPRVDLLAWLDRTSETELARRFPHLHAALRAAVAGLDPGTGRWLAARTISLIGEFHEACWEHLGAAGRARYEADAAAALGDLGDLFSDDDAATLLEEHARGLFRATAPGLDAEGVLRVVGS